MEIEKALKVFIKPENLHIMGLTSLHPYENKLEGSKFFAFIRLLEDIPEQDEFKWLYIPNEYSVCTFLGVQVRKFKNGSFALKHKFAQPI